VASFFETLHAEYALRTAGRQTRKHITAVVDSSLAETNNSPLNSEITLTERDCRNKSERDLLLFWRHI